MLGEGRIKLYCPESNISQSFSGEGPLDARMERHRQYEHFILETLVPFMESLEPLAHDMTRELLEAMGAKPGEIESYGKGAIVGVDGELEHAAIWHAPGGAGIRRALCAQAVGHSPTRSMIF